MNSITTITSKWQMTIPKDVREVLDLRVSNQKVLLEVDKKRKTIAITPVKDLLELAGTFKPRKTYNAVSLRKRMENTYERT